MRKLFSLVLAALVLPVVVSAQSVTVGTAQEVGSIPRHDVFANVTMGAVSVDVRNSARLGSQDRYGQVTVQQKSFSWFVGGGTSQFALTPTATAGITVTKVVALTAFGQKWDDGIKLAGLTAAKEIPLPYVALGVTGTATTDKDTHGVQVSLTHRDNGNEFAVYGSTGSEVYWNPPREVHSLKEGGINVVRTVSPLIALQGNVAAGLRRGAGYTAFRASLKFGL